MEYESPEELKELFIGGHLEELPEELSISGIRYRRSTSNDLKFEDLIMGKKSGMIIYTLIHSDDNMKQFKKMGTDNGDEPGLHEWVMFVWKARSGSIHPFGITSTTPARAKTMRENQDDTEGEKLEETETTPAQTTALQKKDNQWKARVIGNSIQVSFPQFTRGKNMKAKVDTGANISSLHAENINVDADSGTVTFKCPALSNNRLRMKCETQQAVKSADGGTEYRPVVALDVSINGQTIPGVEFNLNDRSQMNYEVLAGQNILHKGKFLIDPTVESKQIDWKALNVLVEKMKLPEHKDAHKIITVEEVYQLIINNEISFDELFKHAHTAGVEAADSVEA